MGKGEKDVKGGGKGRRGAEVEEKKVMKMGRKRGRNTKERDTYFLLFHFIPLH